MERVIKKIGKDVYVLENAPAMYKEYYVIGNHVWRNDLPGWGSAGHGDTKKIVASTREDLDNVPLIKQSFLEQYEKLKPKELKEFLSIDENFMPVYRNETLEEAAERCFEEMKKSNPAGGLKAFIKIAVAFGVEWGKNQSRINKTTNGKT
jgi:hypothetical protein